MGIIEMGDIPGVKNVIAVAGQGGVGNRPCAAASPTAFQFLRSGGRPDGPPTSTGPRSPTCRRLCRPHFRGPSLERIEPDQAPASRLMSMGFLARAERAG